MTFFLNNVNQSNLAFIFYIINSEITFEDFIFTMVIGFYVPFIELSVLSVLVRGFLECSPKRPVIRVRFTFSCFWTKVLFLTRIR